MLNKNRTILNLFIGVFLMISRTSAVNVSEMISEPGILDGIDPVVQVTSPTELDSFTHGLPMNIQWTASDSSFNETPIKIELRKDNDTNLITEFTENDSSFIWSVGEIASGIYQVAITASDSFGNNTNSLSAQFYILGKNMDHIWYVSKEGDDLYNNGTSGHPYASIQRALDECADGDSVLVDPGIYRESISTLQKSVHIFSTSGNEVTVIDGGLAGTDVVTLYAQSILSGFTIQNSVTDQSFRGGIRVEDGTPLIVNNKVINNNDGIICWGNSAPVIRNNLVANANALILCMDQSEPRIENNTLVNGGEGINIYGENATVQAINNIIASNSRWGGIYRQSSPIVPDIQYNDIWNNQPANYAGIDDLTDLNGNLSLDPLFIFPDTMNVWLQSTSACINAGDPTSDYSNEPEPNGDRINIGCYGNTNLAAIQKLQFTNTIQLTTDEDSIYQQILDLPREENVEIIITVDQLPDWLSIDQNDSLIAGVPNNTHVGSHLIRLYAEDNYNRKDTLEYQLTVINTAPVITSSPVLTAWEEVPYSYDVNCSDDGQGEIRYFIHEPSWLSIDSSSGIVSGTPQNEHIGLSNVEIEVEDGNGGITAHSFTLLVKNVNDPPLLAQLPDLIIEEDQNTVLLFTNWQSFVDDIDNDFSELQWRVSNGEDILAENYQDSVKLIPKKDWYGEDSIAVVVSDSTLSDTSFFRLFVTPVNDFATWSLPQDTSLYFGDSLVIDLYKFVNDVDDPDTNLSLNVTTGFTPEDYHLSININDNRILKILPEQNIELINGSVYLSSTDTAGFQSFDTLLLSVYKFNFPPELAQLPDMIGHEDVPIVVPLDNWLAYVTDRDDSLKYLNWYIPGSDNISIETKNDTAIFYPAENWHGSDSVNVFVLDEKDTASVQIIITFQSVADRPRLSLTDFQFCEDETLTVQLDNFVEDVDTPDSLLSWNISYEGATAISPISEFHHALDTERRTLQFWGDLNFFVDSVSVFYSVTDDSGLTLQDNRLVMITPINDPPVVPNLLTYTNHQFEDVIFNIDVSQFIGEISDVETPFNLLGFNLLSSEDILVTKVPESNQFTLQCRADWSGRDTLKLDVSDDSCTVTTYIPIYIQSVNDLPVISSIPDTTFSEDDSVVIDLRKYISDIDTPEDSLKIIIMPDVHQSILYTQFDKTQWRLVIKGIPDGFIENTEIIYQVWDSPDSYTSDTNYVSILAVNDPPVLIASLDTSYYEDEYLIMTYDYLMNSVYDVDNNNSELTINIISDSGSVLCEYNQIDNYYKFYSSKDIDSCGYFNIQILDPLGASCSESFVVDIIPVNDAPVLVEFPDTNIAQNNAFVMKLDGTYFDVDNIKSEISWTVSAAKSQASITENGDSLICVPPVDYVGWDTIYVSINDPYMLSDQDTFRIHFDDSVPPEFTIGIFQNPIASEHINIYFFPDEPVDTIRSVLISGESVDVELVTDIIPNPYYTNYQLPGSANQQIIVTGTDTSGNTGQSDYGFSASYVTRKNGGTIYSPDSTVQIIIGNHSISSDMFVLCLPHASDSTMEKQKSSILLAKKTAVQETIVDNTFKAPQNLLNKNCKIVINNSDQNELSPDTYQGIFRYENSKWVYLKTYTDADESQYWSYSDKLGRYALLGNAPQAPEQLPSRFSLGQNYPNPFNMETTFRFELPELSNETFESSANLIIYNILGQKVATVVNQKMVPGRYIIRWNGVNDSGLRIASGVYFFSLNYGHYLKTKKMVLLK